MSGRTGQRLPVCGGADICAQDSTALANVETHSTWKHKTATTQQESKELPRKENPGATSTALGR